MLLNHAAEYAILGLVYLAKNPKRNVKISEIAKAETIPAPFLQKVFQKLSRAKLVQGAFGPLGGVRLRVPAHKLTLKKIINAVQPTHDCGCSEVVAELQKHADGALLINFLEQLQRDYMKYLNKQTLQKLIANK